MTPATIGCYDGGATETEDMMRTGTWNVIAGAVPDADYAVLTATQIAERADVSATTARRYLAEMVKRGEVRATHTPEGARGEGVVTREAYYCKAVV